MKRTICLLLFIIIVISCGGCGTKRPKGISDQAYEYGLAALETADDYIDGKIDREKAEKNLYHASVLIDRGDGEHDILVSSRISSLKYAIVCKDNGSGTIGKVKEARERLADILGE